MKRLNESHKLYLIRRARRSETAKIASARRGRMRRAVLAAGLDPTAARQQVSVYRNGTWGKAKVIGQPIPAPKLLSFSENYEETVRFINQVRDGLLTNFQPSPRKKRRAMQTAPLIYKTYYDFTTIEDISAPVALVIAAEYDRVRKAGGWRPGAIQLQDWNPRVRAKLNQIGFLSLSGVTEQDEPFVQGEGWRLLRLRSGHETAGETANELLASLGVDIFETSPNLYEAMIEALANIKHHAYPPRLTFAAPHVDGWWMTGMAEANGKLTVMVCDQGVTIPRSLSDPENDWQLYSAWQKLCLRFAGRTPSEDDTSIDGAAIAAAMKVGRTSTHLSYRGRGLKTFESVLDASKGGSLTIRSRCGEYRRTKGSAATFISKIAPLHGTLITWQLQT